MLKWAINGEVLMNSETCICSIFYLSASAFLALSKVYRQLQQKKNIQLKYLHFIKVIRTEERDDSKTTFNIKSS